MVLRKQQGFTLIELVMVIVILGILAATALPKFVNLGRDARAATLQAMQGALNSSITMIRSAALIAGQTNGTLAVAGIGNITLVNGYPQNLKANLDLMLQYDATSFVTANGRISHAKATTISQCQITMANAVNVDTPPVVGIVITGC